MTHRRAAFTFIELSVSLLIVLVLAAISVPVYARVSQGSRAIACMSNLRQIGGALQLYLNDHNQLIPVLAAGRKSKDEQIPVIDNTLDGYTRDKKVFACPADAEGLATSSGTSYYWNVALSGQKLSNLNFFRKREWTVIPLLSDKDPFHPYTDTKVNILYADGHADKEIRFLTALPSPGP